MMKLRARLETERRPLRSPAVSALLRNYVHPQHLTVLGGILDILEHFSRRLSGREGS